MKRTHALARYTVSGVTPNCGTCEKGVFRGGTCPGTRQKNDRFSYRNSPACHSRLKPQRDRMDRLSDLLTAACDRCELFRPIRAGGPPLTEILRRGYCPGAGLRYDDLPTDSEIRRCLLPKQAGEAA